MRSGELADLVGVTVRALRHYHQIGLLAEPGRHGNGYRDYTHDHVIRVLRIKRLAALGIPLERMGPVLDADARDQEELLREVEDDLGTEIERLEQQRSLVRQAREAATAPDLAPALAATLARFAVAGTPTATSTTERELTVLLSHLLDADRLTRLVAVYDRLATPELVARAADLGRAFDALTDEADPADVDDVVERYVAELGELVAALSGVLDGALSDAPVAEALLDAYSADRHTEAQQLALARIAERTGGPQAP